MKAVLQRVTRARVTVGADVTGAIDEGVLVFLGVMKGDAETDARRLAGRLARFRIFRDEAGRMNRSVLETGGAALVVSQFTLAADGKKGRRPSFTRAAEPALAEALYLVFVGELEALGVPTATGRFGALMAVELVNDGPVTFLLEESGAGAPGTA